MDGSTGHLVPDLEYRHHARQVTRLVRRDWVNGHTSRVLSLAGEGPLSAELPTMSAIKVRRRRGFLPPSGSPELWNWLRGDPPAALHVWGRSALWTWQALKPLIRARTRWIYSPLVGERLSRFDRLLLADCGEIRIPHPNFPGLNDSRCRLLDPLPAPEGVASSGSPESVPEKIILAVGRMDRFASFLDAIWAFDILYRADPELRLVLIGDGPARRRLREFADMQASAARIDFLGSRANPESWLRRAFLVWLPNDPQGGLHRLQDCVSAGRAAIVPRLLQFGQSGYDGGRLGLYRAGSGVDLASASANFLFPKDS